MSTPPQVDILAGSRAAPRHDGPPAEAASPRGSDIRTDRALMAAVVRHDGDAYAELYRRHAVSVAAVTRMLLGNGPECDDVVTGVFIGIWVSPERFDPTRGSLVSYLRLSARGRSIDLLRAESRRRRREEDEARQAPNARAAPLDIDAGLLAFEVSTELRRAVSALPPPEREAIRLAFFGEMSYRSVALLLGAPEGTVKSRIRSGLQRLRENGMLESPTAS